MNPREYRRMADVEDRHWWYVGLHELILAVVRRAAAGAAGPLRIFDAGCGTGRLLQLLAAVGDAAGCDVAPEAVAICRERSLAGVALADLNSVELPEGAYDVITVVDVLYHQRIRDEAAVLRALCRALKPGGLLIRDDPAFEALRSAHDRAVHTRERYRARGVRERLVAAGLVPELVTYRLGALAPLIAVHRLARRGAGRGAAAEVASDVGLPRPWVNRALLAAVRLENRFLLRTGCPVGTSVFALARRPPPAGRGRGGG